MRRTRLDERDLLVLTGVEPDYRWREFATRSRRASPAASASPSGSASARSRRPCRTPAPCRSSAPNPSPVCCAARSGPGRRACCACRRRCVSALEIDVPRRASRPSATSPRSPTTSRAPIPPPRSPSCGLSDATSVSGSRRRAARGGAPAARPPRRRGRGRRDDPGVRRAARVDGRRVAPAVGRRPDLRHRALPARNRQRRRPATLSRPPQGRAARRGRISRRWLWRRARWGPRSTGLDPGNVLGDLDAQDGLLVDGIRLEVGADRFETTDHQRVRIPMEIDQLRLPSKPSRLVAILMNVPTVAVGASWYRHSRPGRPPRLRPGVPAPGAGPGAGLASAGVSRAHACPMTTR